MRALVLWLCLLFAAAPACANPGLHGTWSAVVNGEPMVVTFADGGSGSVDGKAMRWQTMGPLLFIEQDGEVGTYQFQLQGKQLNVSGGNLGGGAVFTRGKAATKGAAAGLGAARGAGPATAGGGTELVGKWCKGGAFSASSGGGSSSMTCFELRGDGSYAYQHEGSISAYSSGMYGGSASQSADAGRWSVSADGHRLTARSQRGQVNTYTLEKRNHPKNKRDPMLCLDGDCYTTYWQRAPW